jgi:hypothetical protein
MESLSNSPYSLTVQQLELNKQQEQQTQSATTTLRVFLCARARRDAGFLVGR